MRARITVANQFLTWLEDNHIRLADATQHDVSTWVGQGASTRHRLRDFLRWAHAGGFAADLEVRWLVSEGLPGHILDDDERWALLWRCLRDDSLSLRLRVAGALVLLYGQIPSRIVELTTGSITTSGSDTYLALRDHPVLLPPPLAALITQLVAHNSRWQATTSGAETPAWLFPRRPHRLTPWTRSPHPDVEQRNRCLRASCPWRGALRSRRRSAGSGARRGPRLSVSAATGWVAVAARDEAHYLEARIAKPPQPGDGIGPIHAGAARRCRCPQLPFGR